MMGVSEPFLQEPRRGTPADTHLEVVWAWAIRKKASIAVTLPRVNSLGILFLNGHYKRASVLVREHWKLCSEGFMGLTATETRTWILHGLGGSGDPQVCAGWYGYGLSMVLNHPCSRKPDNTGGSKQAI